MTAAPTAPPRAHDAPAAGRADHGAAPPHPGTPAPPARTRVRFGLMSGVLIVASTMCLVLVNLIAQRYPARLDVTATREQALAPRTTNLIASLKGNYEIVIAADWSSIDGRAARRVRDVLDLFTRASRNITATTIDTGTAGGAASYDRLLRRLAERDAPRVREHGEKIEHADTVAISLADALESLSPRLQAVRDAIPADAPAAEENRRFFEYQAAQCRVNAKTLRDINTASREALLRKTGPLGVPDLDQAAAPTKKAMADLQTGLRQVADSIQKFADAAPMPAQARALAGPIARDVAKLRDDAAIQADALARLPKLDSVRVAKTLQATQAALVIGPPDAGVTAIPLAWLFPPGEAIDAAGESRADMRRRNEDLFATALDTLARPVSPILVFVHSWPPPPLLDRQRGFGDLVERLGLRGIDVVEWAAAEQPEGPSLGALNPKGDRPVVYVTFNSDPLTGADRADTLGAVLARLVEEGRPILLSISPSMVPTAGSADKTVSFLTLFGLKADTARPLMRDTLTPGGRVVIPDLQAIARDTDHPIAGAVRGLRTLFQWPVPLRVLPESEAPRARVWPLYSLEDRTAWAESEWVDLWQTAAPGKRRVMPPNPPTGDSARDDASGSWVVAAAAERASPAGKQRLVAVSSNTWFMDGVTMQQAPMVDGRAAAANPGNIELFEAAVYWLAGQDDRIGAGPSARAVPVIRDLGPGALATLRWLVVLGLPALTLVAGVLWRLWRG